jgi:alpha,alpha-trehalose phosphorylase
MSPNHARAARLRERLEERLSRSPSEHAYPVSDWRIVERRFEPEYLPALESVFAVANGYLGLRGTPEEGTPTHEAGAVLNGFHETWPIVYPEDAYGLARTGQTIVNATDGTLIRLYVDDEPFDLTTAKLLRFERVLDMQIGVLSREVEWETARGHRMLIRSRRLASLEHRHLAAMDYEVVALDAAVRIAISSELVTYGPGEASDDPRRGKALAEKALVPLATRAHGHRAVLSLTTRNSGLQMACGMEHAIDSPQPVTVETSAQGDGARLVVLAELEPDQPLRLSKYVAYHWAPKAPAGDLAARVDRTLDHAARDGYDMIEFDHRRHVEDFWARSDVQLEGAPDLQQAVRFNLYELMQATARGEGLGVPAKGLTGHGYEGHYFWDTEIYVVPFLVHTSPQWAKQVLQFRCGMLDAARKRARDTGHNGALYPWRTISGEEASAWYAAGTAQYHINADIAYAMRQYGYVTGDLAFLLGDGAQVLVETARLWMELGFFSERAGGRFVINSVTGPDEYTTVVDNNAYTNLMAKENLEGAVHVIEWLAAQEPEAYLQLVCATRLTEAEVDGWRRAAELMYVPRHEELGIVLQDERFLERKPWDFDATPIEKYPLLLHHHPLELYRHQVIKQTDVVLARQPLLRGREAPHVRLLRPADHRRLDALGVHPERGRLRGRLPRGGPGVLRPRLRGRPGRRPRQHRRRHPHRLVRRHVARARRRLRRPARGRRRGLLQPAPAGGMGSPALPCAGARSARRGRHDPRGDDVSPGRGPRAGHRALRRAPAPAARRAGLVPAARRAAACGLEGDGDREPEDGDEARDVAGLARGLWDHRVDEHDQQGAGGEAVDARLEVAGGGVGDRIAGQGGQRADDGHRDPQPADRRRAAPRRAHLAGRADGLGQVRHEDGRQQADADALAGREADAEHHLLGDAVEEGAEGERRAGAAARRSPLHEAVEPEVGERADGETGSHRGAAADLQTLLGEIEADRAHEGAGAEGEHHAHGAVRPRAGQAQQRADDERGRGERAPAQRRCHGMMGAGCGRSERAARTSARGVRAPQRCPRRASEIATPTTVIAAGHTTASDARAPPSSACPAANGRATSSAAPMAAGPAPGSGTAAPEPCARTAATTMAGATGRPKASRKHVAEPSRSTRAPAWKGSTWRAQCRGLRSTAAPRPTSRTVRRTRAERAASSATAAAASAATASSAAGGAWRLPTPSATAASIIVRPETVSNEASAQSVPASAGHVASRSSRRASVTRTASPPRGESTPLRPAPQTYHAHTRRRVTSGHVAASTPRQATPRETCPHT